MRTTPAGARSAGAVRYRHVPIGPPEYCGQRPPRVAIWQHLGMGFLQETSRRFAVWKANKRQDPVRQAIARTQDSLTRRIDQQVIEASLGMVALQCRSGLRSRHIDRIARRARAELAAGHPVRLFVPLTGLPSPNAEADAKGCLHRIHRAIGFGMVEQESPAPMDPRQVGLVLWPPSQPPGDRGVREPRRPRPDSGSHEATAEE